MLFNDTKFVRISIGPNNDFKQVPLYTPEYSHVIERKSSVRDLGVMVDDNGKYDTQINNAIKKTKDKCSWMLTTFNSRDHDILRTLWKSLAQPYMDYAVQVWSLNHNDKGKLAAMESPLRDFTRKI